MKKIQIEIRIPEEEKDKVATAIRTEGYSNESISDQFELLGVMENLKGIIQDRINKLTDVSI